MKNKKGENASWRYALVLMISINYTFLALITEELWFTTVVLVVVATLTTTQFINIIKHIKGEKKWTDKHTNS